MKARQFEVRLVNPKDRSKTMIHKVTAETDMAAVAMVMYNMRDERTDWFFESVSEFKER
jgi:hypothetical protein